MLSLRIQIELHVVHVLAAVGEETTCWFGLHALPLEQLKMTALGFLVIGLNPGKAPSRQLLFSFLVTLKGQDALQFLPRLQITFDKFPAPERKLQVFWSSGRIAPAASASNFTRLITSEVRRVLKRW